MDSHWSIFIELWFKSIKDSYIVEFTIDCSKSFNTAERKFTKGPHERYISRIPFWIEIKLCENSLMKLQSDSMEV